MHRNLDEMKILAYVDPLGGSDYHRLKTSLEYLGADFTDKLTQEVVKNYDILWTTKSSVISPATISLWKEMFGLKYVYDIDDSLDIPNNYHNSKKLQSQVPLVINRLIEADWVVTSTVEIYEEVKQYNPNITIIPNRIDYSKFPCKQETFEQFCNRKIRVGIVGAFTHFQDWKSIKGELNTLVKNPTFIEQAEFIMGGYHESAKDYWKEFSNLGLYIKSLPVDKYLRLYQEFDIILVPLVNNQFNRCKSSLRLLEAGTHNCFCILSSLYREKTDCPDLGHYYAEKDSDFFHKTLELIENRELLWQKKLETGQKARELDFQEVVKEREKICQKVLEVQVPETKYEIYSIYYDEGQPTQYRKIFNQTKDKAWRFEYNPIIKTIPQTTTEDWIGMFSWKFPLKTLVGKKRLETILDENKKYDCINFCKPLGYPYLKFTEHSHPGFMNLFTKVCKDLGLKVKEPRHTIYSNFFVLKGNLYREYVREIIVPALNLLEGKYWDLANKDARYKSGLSQDKLKEYTGLDYYNFVTFILERMISIWVDNKKIKTLDYR